MADIKYYSVLIRNNIKLQKKTKTLLGLMKKFRLLDQPTNSPTTVKSAYTLNFSVFKKIYVSLLNIIYVFDFIRMASNPDVLHLRTTDKIVYFYAKLSKINKNDTLYTLKPKRFHTYYHNNGVIFSKPAKQLFLILFKNKPIFIFTSGLMRIVMNEKRKSNKKLYKVAVSLIKLSLILLTKKHYFDSCYLKVNNVGQLRSKILMTFMKHKLHNMVHYILFKISFDIHSQKFKTRRAIKKYVKKRFKLAN